MLKKNVLTSCLEKLFTINFMSLFLFTIPRNYISYLSFCAINLSFYKILLSDNMEIRTRAKQGNILAQSRTLLPTKILEFTR